mmetsp:Transcript_10409/g.19760  ORF Transcript_10409/g.19760 Transcript_10409/m.19760 type:complete len:261 (+) Transcript_10409:81-863(+)
MGYDTQYKGKVIVKGTDLKSSKLVSIFETKLEKSGKAYLEFNGGEIAGCSVGVRDVKVHDKVTGSVNYCPQSKKGKAVISTTAVEGMEIIASPNLPPPASLAEVDIKMITKHKLSNPELETKLTIYPFKSQGMLEVLKKVDHALLKQAKMTVDSGKQSASLMLVSHTKPLFQFDHSMELTLDGLAVKSKPNGKILLKTQFNKELSSKVQIDMSSSGSAKGKLMAEYKMGKLTAVGTVPVTSLSAQGLGQPTFEITSTYDF